MNFPRLMSYVTMLSVVETKKTSYESLFVLPKEMIVGASVSAAIHVGTLMLWILVSVV